MQSGTLLDSQLVCATDAVIVQDEKLFLTLSH